MFKQVSTNQLSASVDHLVPSTLIVTPVPFLGTVIHLGVIVMGKGKTLQLVMGSDMTSNDEVLEREFLEFPLGGTGILDLVIDY